MFTIETDAFDNKELSEIFNSFSVFYVDNESFDFNSYANMKINLSESDAIIIQETEKYQNDNTFLICFKNTILLIKQFHLKTLQEPIFNISKLPIFFLTRNTQNHFRENIKVQDDQNKTYDDFINEVNNFQKYIKNIILTPTLSVFPGIWEYIKSIISGYLIQESYAKINNNQRNIYNQMIDNGLNIKSMTKNEIEIQELIEKECIDLRPLGCGQSGGC